MLAILKNEKIARVFSWCPLRVIGIISYSIFLWHFPIFAVSGLENLHDLSFVQAILWVLGVVLPACFFWAGVSYIVIEKAFLARRF